VESLSKDRIQAKTNSVQRNATQNTGVKRITEYMHNALSVVRDMRQTPTQEATPALESVRIVKLVRLKRKRSVYGITVEGLHEYFADGLLVANSAYYKVGLGMMLRTDEVGGVQPKKVSKIKTTYRVREDSTVPVKEALGMELDTLLERSLRTNRKRRVK
jgi:hypothetical protein